VEVTDLPGDRFDEASVVMADAFLDDPGCKAVGPTTPSGGTATSAASAAASWT
jgi:hypothetical protein